MKKFLLLFLFLSAALSSSRAATINYSGFEAQFVTESGLSAYSQLQEGSYISLGTFNLSGGFAFNLIGTPAFDTWSEISAYYTEYGSTSIFDSEGFGVFTSEAGAVGIEGTPLFIVGFDNINPVLSTRLAIVGGSGGAWDAPSDDPLSGVLSVDIGGGDATVVYGVITDIDGYGGLGVGKDIALSAVPESNSFAYLAMAFFVYLMFSLARRRVF
jgi:hypothetical protein